MNKFNDLKSRVFREVNRLDGDSGLYVKFLNTDNTTLMVNENEQFWATSLVKLLVVAKFYDKISKTHLI